MGKSVKIIAAIIILIAVPKIIQSVMLKESRSGIAKQMTKVAREVNGELPKRIDSITTVTKAEFDTTTFTYRVYYTMNPGYKLKKSELASIQADAVGQICSGSMKLFLEKNITVEYLYTFNPDGGADQEASFTVPPTSCK